MKANKIRKLYLDFFRSKEHKIVLSAPIVVKDDPTLMFANAGMNQFKDIFLGNSSPDSKRIVNSQKCLRVSGKHNDLEEVGHDTYHHTMFEMLGSWSFGDYFKVDAINWAWEFLTDVCKLDKERFYVTVFEGVPEENLEKDNEAFDIWCKHLPIERVLDGNKKDNFWEMGDTGPCGPCSEIHYDNRDDKERLDVSGALLVNKDHPQVIEIWNLVFMQFNRSSNQELTQLPRNHVDTGMGFERLVMIMQGVSSNYDTDIFQPLIKTIAKKANYTYGHDNKKDIAVRVIADHIRAISFSIADGQIPSNIKAGYVIRRILRRAVRYGYNFLEIQSPLMYELVDVLVDQLAGQFPELSSQKKLISMVVKEEEESFLRTLEGGLKRINEMIDKAEGNILGKDVFELYDTFGFPVDLTSLILNEHNLTFDQNEFNNAMSLQKKRSQIDGKIDLGDWVVLAEDDIEEFVGYNQLEVEVNITRYREVKSKQGRQYQIVFNLTPFYAEGGGQIGDTGFIKSTNDKVRILDTKKENKLIIHLVDTLPSDLSVSFLALVDLQRRISISRNHTATHLLHESLREILGDHVTQKGSLVNDNYLRFDFSHFSKIEKQDLRNIEALVNSKILANIQLEEYNNLPLSKAKKSGAMMLFGEKYEDVVRMIQFNSSKELCGGTHVNSTGEIGLFKIISEGSISSGIRRVEALTGMQAFSYINKNEDVLEEIVSVVKNKDVSKGIRKLVEDNKSLTKELVAIKKVNIANMKQDLLDSCVKVNGIRFIGKEIDIDIEAMKSISFSLRKENNLALVLATRLDQKAFLSVMISDDLISKGLNASVMINTISKEIEGGGGGQAFFATAGGRNIRGIPNSLKIAEDLLKA